MVSLTQLVVIFCMVTTTAMQLNLTPNIVLKTCVAKNNVTGVCVHESVCNEEHTIISTGVLDESEYREKKQCPSKESWCCTSGVIPPPHIDSTLSDKCLAPETDVCPWCVLLYNAIDEKTLAHRPFCLGALIGSKVIITSSTCLKAAQKKLLYAQVPNSANPGKNYTINRRHFHPNYNSGTHEYDFGITVIDTDVTFEKGKSRGACIDFDIPSEPSETKCVGYGFDNRGKITSTIMTVSNTSCGISGNSRDSACGKSSDTVCIVAGGGPVLCQRKKNQSLLYLVGLARSTCDSDKVTLGSIAHSKEWIEADLASMNIAKDLYT